MKNFYLTLILFIYSIFGFAQITAPTGTSPEVGITEGQLSVSLSGAATYSIPIAVPPGINGVVPQVSLVYNSQGGNGLAGYGWNTSGVSAITRIPRTKFHDGVVGGVNLDANDRFALDGQRLIVKNNGVYGTANSEYETENFSNLKITAIGVSPLGANYGPATFKVGYPDGSVAYYGNDTNSRSIATWGISYWENPQGVRISYNYHDVSLANNNLTIEFIKYGTTGTIAPINQIQFVYKPRQRPEQSFIGGQNILVNSILSEIKVLGNSVGFRNYVLGHNMTSLGYERLESITEKSGDGTKTLNPTVFSYEDTEKSIKYSGITTDTNNVFNGNGNNRIISGDFIGDEKMDFLVPTSPIDDSSRTTYYLFTNSIDNSEQIGFEHNVGDYSYIFPATILNSKNEVMPKQGWTTVKPRNNNQLGYIFEVYAAEETTTPTGKKTQIFHQYDKIVQFPDGENKRILSGDFNGDGLTDFVAFDYGSDLYADACQGFYDYRITNNKSVYFVDLRRDNTTNFLTYSGELQTHSIVKIEVADVNGDGKSDFLFFEAGRLTVYNLNQFNQLEVLFIYEINDLINLCFDYSISGGFSQAILIGDYNGDGKSDFLMPRFGLFTSTGTGFTRSVEKHDDLLYGNSITPIDFDNDGKTDLLEMISDYFHTVSWGLMWDTSKPTLRIRHYFNKNGAFSKENSVYKEYSYSSLNLLDGIQLTIPLFSLSKYPRKKIEFACFTGNRMLHFESQNDFGQEKLLRSVTTGSGVKESISYLPLTKNAVLEDAVDLSNLLSGSVYSPLLFTEKYPQKNIESEESIDVVAKIEKQSSTVHKKQFYNYSGAVSNMEGLGFLGFRAVMQTNWVPATATWQDYENTMISSVSVADPHLRGANVANYSYKGFFPVSKIEYIPKVNPPVSKNVTVNDTRTVTETVLATNSIRFLPGARIAPTVGNTFKAQITPDYDPNGYVGTNSSPPIDLISKSLSFYESNISPTKVFRLKNTQSNTYNILDNTSSETRTDYDDYNNPSESTSKIKNAGVVEQSTTTKVVYDDQPNGTTYYIGRPKSKTQTVAVSGDTSTSNELYEYTNHLLKKVKKKANNSDYIIEDNEYDTYGNNTKKTITVPAVAPNPAPAPRITNYEYNPASPYNGRFLTKSIDIQGLATQYDFNPNNGVLKSVTNPYNITTSYLYDSWFRKETITDYLGKKMTISYLNMAGLYGMSTKIRKVGDDGSLQEIYYDDLGREVSNGEYNINNSFSYSRTEYDIYDRKVKVYEPFDSFWGYGDTNTLFSTTSFDEYGRIKESKSYTGKTTTMNYSGLTTTVSDGIKTKTAVKNAIGNVVSMTDTPGGTINYTYFANGNLKTTNYDGVQTIIEQDDWGRKMNLKDPSAGEYKYKYNGFGETTSETTPNGTTTYNLDDFGRLDTKTINGKNTNSKTTYVYNPTSKLLDSSIFEDIQAGTTTTSTYSYDTSKRLYKTVEDTPSYATFTKQFTFDSFGRVENETSIASLNGKSSSKTIQNTYKNGYPWQILSNEATPKVLWQTNTTNARGQLLTAQLGNGIAITNAYDALGYVTQLKHDKTGTNPANIMTLNTTFDPIKGNLKSRNDSSLFGWSEDFTNSYDSQDRLTSYKNGQGQIEYQSYDNRGKITQNSLGQYNYVQTAYRNSSIALTPEAKTYYVAKPLQTISYNVFKSPVEIIENDANKVPIEKLSFTYNDNNDRSMMYYGGAGLPSTRQFRKHYSADGTMEIKEDRTLGTTEFITYLGGDGYTAPVVYKKTFNTSGIAQEQTLYLHRDYQGSILAISNNTGAVLEKRLFDAWGSLISVQNGSSQPIANGSWLIDRGYTGHEHLQSVGLINMNGRLYDPKLHRFLQPDNNIQDPLNTQNYNRYSYVLNNPLKYTDSSGEEYISNHDGSQGGPCYSCPPSYGYGPPAGYLGSAESWNSGWSTTGFGSDFASSGSNWSSGGFGGSGFGGGSGGSSFSDIIAKIYKDAPAGVGDISFRFQNNRLLYCYSTNETFGNVGKDIPGTSLGTVYVGSFHLYGYRAGMGGNVGAQGGGGVNAIDLVDYGVGGLGEAKNLMSYLWKSSSNASQWRAAYQASKTLGVGASVLKNGVSPGLKTAGKYLTGVAVLVTAGKVISTGQVHASDVLALSMTALGATGFGAPIATAFFAADLLTLAITGQSIGNHLDKAVGQPLIDFGYGRN